jgi:C1A family cysteine protease
MAWSEELNRLNPLAHFGAGPFSDMSREDFASKYLMPKRTTWVKPPPIDRTKSKKFLAADPDPNNYDWSSAGVITPVKNQGQCGSCWAFSATETIESYWTIAGNQLPTLAPEQIVDCDTSDTGCNGGEPATAYQYVESAGGLDTESSYPYTAGESGSGGTCDFQSGSVAAKVSNYNSVSGESGLYQQLSSASGGPVSVCVDASSWQNSQGGALTTCGDSIDHCVQATGYMNYHSTGTWNVRNSWGESWGQSGYIVIQIGQDLCGIGDEATVVSC